MEEKIKKEVKSEKLSYEQLEDVARQLSEQLRQARERIGQMGGVLARLPYLFEVTKAKEGVFSTDFVITCAKEIEDIMTIPENNSDEGVSEDNGGDVNEKAQ